MTVVVMWVIILGSEKIDYYSSHEVISVSYQLQKQIVVSITGTNTVQDIVSSLPGKNPF